VGLLGWLEAAELGNRYILFVVGDPTVIALEGQVVVVVWIWDWNVYIWWTVQDLAHRTESWKPTKGFIRIPSSFGRRSNGLFRRIASAHSR
jgi:hypothetical protein